MCAHAEDSYSKLQSSLLSITLIFQGREIASVLVVLSLVSYGCLCLNKYFCDSLVNVTFDPAELNQENLC